MFKKMGIYKSGFVAFLLWGMVALSFGADPDPLPLFSEESNVETLPLLENEADVADKYAESPAEQVSEPSQDSPEVDVFALPQFEEEGTSKTSAQSGPVPTPPEGLVVEVIGKGRISESMLLLAVPGEIFEFRVNLGQELGRLGELPGDARPTGGSAPANPQSGTLSLQANRQVDLRYSGGEVERFRPFSIFWRAPLYSGLQTLNFAIQEDYAVSGAGQGKWKNQNGDQLQGKQEVTVMVQYYFDRNQTLIEDYDIGVYQNEKSSYVSGIVQRRPELYTPPQWFLKVTPDLLDYKLSPHFELGDFASPMEKGRPHYIAVDTDLLDYLEAVHDRVQKVYGPQAKVRILRAYMSPRERQQLAQRGANYTTFSRFQYGDAVALVVDREGNGILSDLNMDGQINRDDANELADLLESVRQSMKMKGGLGVLESPEESSWPDTPYVVVDLRGVSSRW